MSSMFKKSERLSRLMIGELLRKGQRYSGALFDIRFLSSTRFMASIVVSKKVAPRSVARHLLKRRMVAALTSQKSTIGNINLVCVLKKTSHVPTTKEYSLELSEFARNSIRKSV